MANRVYLSAGTAGYTPTTVKGSWTVGTATAINSLDVTPNGTAATTAVAVGATGAAGRTVLIRRFISAPFLKAGTISGNVSGVIGMFESNAALNANPRIFAYVTAGDSDTNRGTLFTYAGGTEMGAATATSGITVASTAMTSTAVQAGDRLCIEVGYTLNAASGSAAYTGTLHYGGANFAADLAASGDPSAAPSWLEFSGTGFDGFLSQKTSSLVDDFEDNTIDFAVRWPNSYGPIFEQNGYAVIEQLAPVGGVDQYAGYYSARNYSIQDSQITVQVPGIGSANGATGQAWAALTVTSQVDGTTFEIFFDYFNGNLVLRDNVGYFDATPTTISLASLAGLFYYIRLREASGTMYWETSPDGFTWTQRRTLATHGFMRHGSLGITMQGYRDSGTADFTYFNDFNILPQPYVFNKAGAMMQFVMD